MLHKLLKKTVSKYQPLLINFEILKNFMQHEIKFYTRVSV